MRITSSGCLLGLCVLLAAGCSKSSDTPASRPARSRQINVYMWSEYIDPAIPADFEKATGIKPRIDVYESTEEMIAKLQQAGGADQYDVVVATDHAVRVLARLGLLRPLDLDKVPNRANVAERFRNPPYDPESRYSLPYQWGTIGLMYRKDRIKDLDPSWAVVFAPDRQPGPFVLIDSMRDMLGAALKYQGRSINSRDADELRRAGELILQAKKCPHMLG